MSRSSGLRNKCRSRGRSTYARLGKSKVADRYGKYVNGRCTEDEKIGRHLRSVDSEYVDDLS